MPETLPFVQVGGSVVKTHRARLVPIVPLALLLLASCASVTPPVDREPGYPDAWPDIASLGVRCVGLTGRYANQGTVVDREGSAQPIALTEILLDGSPPVVDSVSLEAVPKKSRGTDKNTPARLLVGLGDQTSTEHRLSDCFCIERALFCPGLHMSGAGAPGVGLISGQQNVWLTRGADGSLLARIENYTAGIVVAVPVHSQSELWARFDPVAE